MIYENGSLKRLLADGGYFENGVYHFYLQDHLGNNRVVSKADGTVVRTNHYYPYGMSFGESTYEDKQPYKYNGKELDTANGLNLYDFAARQLSLDVPYFTTPDPLVEKYYSASPYIYCSNNPINNIDPDGRNWYKVEDAIYYSLMGDQYLSASKEGKTMQKIDEALIKDAIPTKYDGFGNKLSGDESTDFDIGEYTRVSALGLREDTSFQFEINGGYVA